MLDCDDFRLEELCVMKVRHDIGKAHGLYTAYGSS